MSEKIDWTNGVLAILGSDGRAKGAGFVVSAEGLILTCAHVLAQAGWSYQAWDEPVWVRFKATRRPAEALVQEGCFRSQVEGDIALLALTGRLPDEVKPLPLAAAAETEGHTVYTWGYPTWLEGLAGGGKVVDVIPGRPYDQLQFNSTDTTHGYSGGPVWDAAMQRVTGMVQRSRKGDESGRLAYTTLAAPAEVLVDVCQDRLELSPPDELLPVTTDATLILDEIWKLTEWLAAVEGQKLRAALESDRLDPDEAALIESRYRDLLVRELRMHSFQGIVQVKQAMRLPLADIYQELSLLRLGGEEEHRQVREQMLAMDLEQRVQAEEERLQDRVGDALVGSQRLVILGDPGAGKTISLRYIALMLAQGQAARLGLEAPFFPLLVPLRDYARDLGKDRRLRLDHFLLDYIAEVYDADPRQGDLLRLAMESGACLFLFDGLDEVGGDLGRGRSLRDLVVKRLGQFADRWAGPEMGNRIVVTSRIEGYWAAPLNGFDHVQLSPLRPPDEVDQFLRRWFTAYEMAQDDEVDRDLAEARAGERVAAMLPDMMDAASVRRLATNPLLLTILALIHENVGKMPNRRIKLYEICAQTLIETWREAQTDMPDDLLADLGEETVIRVMAPLAYWLHEEQPGGTASVEEWQERLVTVLADEGFEDEAPELAKRFLEHARYSTGLLAERGQGLFGFFHLTFEEYLAAREIARQRVEQRREMLKAHWADPRWREVILLAAGQLGIVEARRDDVSDFIGHLLAMEPDDPADQGRQVVLAGRAVVDIGRRSLTRHAFLVLRDRLRQTMHSADPETGAFTDPPHIAVRVRYEAGEALDELGWLPPDLNDWLPCPGCADDGGDLLAMKYPVTNAQYSLFIAAGGYGDERYWSDEGWHWLQRQFDAPDEPKEPRFWRNPRFGSSRPGYPVVGVTWYEAMAYAAWLADFLTRASQDQTDISDGQHKLVAGLLAAGAQTCRLPDEDEWLRLAGGDAGGRYPWDPQAGPATESAESVVARANVKEAELDGPSPVVMYPLGEAVPSGLMEMAGNVWEWTATRDDPFYILRGSAFYRSATKSGCGARYRFFPLNWPTYGGFRVVAPAGSGS